MDDAGCTAEIFVKFVQMLKDRVITDLDGVNQMSALDKEAVKKLPSHHVILLAKNEIGRVNLYRMVSWSHLDYYSRVPRIPKSVLQKAPGGPDHRFSLRGGRAVPGSGALRSGGGDREAGQFL